jgi:hypothetical protein
MDINSRFIIIERIKNGFIVSSGGWGLFCASSDDVLEQIKKLITDSLEADKKKQLLEDLW